MPLPLEPETWNPARTVVKIARPWAFAMTLDGIVRRTRGFLPVLGSVGLVLAGGCASSVTEGVVGLVDGGSVSL